MATLTVIAAFGPYTIGQSISDAATIAAILASPQKIFVVTVVNASPGSGVIVPTRPDAVAPVVGVPSAALAVTFGFALDTTSTPNTLYQWLGTAWSAILQAGSGTSPPLAAPGAIAAAPTLSTATSSSLMIAWLAPTTGGAPADYLVQYRASGTTPWTALDEGSTALSATIPGLVAATSYDVQIIASNSAGQGTASPILTTSTVTAAPVLQALGLASLAAVAGQPFSAAITGQTAGSQVNAVSTDNTVLTATNGQVSGTFAAAGQPTVTLTETLAGATGSPKSTQLAVTVSASGPDLTNPANTELLHNL